METVGSSVADCDPASLGFCVDICKMGQGHLLLKLSGDKTRGQVPQILAWGFLLRIRLQVWRGLWGPFKRKPWWRRGKTLFFPPL